MATKPSETERTMLEVVQALRDNPEKYAAFRRALNAAGTDEAARVQALLRYATSEQELAALMPRQAPGEPQELVWTTVTVTTVLVSCSAY